MYKFSDVFEFHKKSKIKAGDGKPEGKYPFYTSSTELSKYVDNYLFGDESLIFGTGGNASVHFAQNKFAVSTDCLVAQANTKDVNPKFVYYYLSGNIHILEQGFKGAGLKHISKTYISEITFPKFSRKKQDEIVQVLDTVDNLTQKRKEQFVLLDDYLKSVFFDMFGDPRSDSRWNLVDFGDVIDVLTDYHANGSYEVLRKHVKLKSIPDYALMVRTTDLENRNFIDDVKYISKEAYNFLEKSKIYGEEIIINKIGSAGNVYLMPNLNRPVSLGMNAFLLRFKKTSNNIFIFYLLSSDYGRSIIKSKVKGAVTKTIRKDALRSLKIPLPPLELQIQFVSIVKQVEKTKQKMRASLGEMDNHFNALMQRYFE